MTPEKLLKALETAESGSRELDASVAAVVGQVESPVGLEFTSAPDSAVEAIPARWKVYDVGVGDDGRYVVTLSVAYDDATSVTGNGNKRALAICSAAVLASMVDRVVRGGEIPDDV